MIPQQDARAAKAARVMAFLMTVQGFPVNRLTMARGQLRFYQK
jgi:hypothetical protein